MDIVLVISNGDYHDGPAESAALVDHHRVVDETGRVLTSPSCQRPRKLEMALACRVGSTLGAWKVLRVGHDPLEGRLGCW
jgi:hypothetical protein